MSYEVTDEQDRTWVVDKGDPAETSCKVLERAGFKSYVLPSPTLINGWQAKLPIWQPLVDAAETACAGLTLLDKVPARMAKQLQRTAERRVRMLECIRQLAVTP